MGETTPTRHTFRGDFKRFFGRGLGILLPSIVTLWLLWQAFVFVFNNVAEPINRGLRVGVIQATPLLFEEEDWPTWYVVTPDQVGLRSAAIRLDGMSEMSPEAIERMIRLGQFRSEWDKHWYLDGLGFIVAIILIYLAGLLLGNYLGRQFYGRIESLIARIPGFKQVYPHVKQVVDLIFGDSSKKMKAFSEVVLVEYPNKGTWSVGFVTGSSFGDVRAVLGGDVVSIFIPTSPTPMTGFVINVLRKDIVKLDLSIDQALRFIITAGVLTPEHGDMASSGESKSSRAKKEIERTISESAEGESAG